MKQAICAILVVGLAVSLSGNLFAASYPISDPRNRHNLSKDATHTTGIKATAASGETRICIFCHTPHGADPQSPLWSRKHITDSGKTFPMYDSGFLEIKFIPEAEYDDNSPSKYPNGATRMCLSCHDGSTAPGFGIGDLTTGDTIAMTVPNLNGLNSAIDLSETHPVSFVYDDGAGVVLGQIDFMKPGEYQLPPSAGIAPLDALGRMQCTTCHDPHADTNLSGSDTPFWRHDTGFVQDTCDQCHVAGPDGGNSPPVDHDPTTN